MPTSDEMTGSDCVKMVIAWLKVSMWTSTGYNLANHLVVRFAEYFC